MRGYGVRNGRGPGYVNKGNESIKGIGIELLGQLKKIARSGDLIEKLFSNLQIGEQFDNLTNYKKIINKLSEYLRLIHLAMHLFITSVPCRLD